MVDELTAMFRVCMHIKGSGDRCNSPAMKGMNFCYHHIGGKVASLVREGATYDASAQLDFDYPADRESIQQNMFLVAQALREGKIDNPTANTYIRIFRACEQNLHRWEKKQKNSGKTKMQPPANEATDADSTNTDVITPTDVILSKRAEAVPNTDVILSKREARVEGPAVSTPAQSTQPTTTEAVSNTNVIPTEVSKANEAGVPGTRGVRVLGWEAEEPALPPPSPTNIVIPTEAAPSQASLRPKGALTAL